MSETHVKILARDLGKAGGCGLRLVLFRVHAFSLSQTRPSRSLEQAKFSSVSRKGMWFNLRYACVVMTVVFNPLSPKSDQHQISLCNINAL